MCTMVRYIHPDVEDLASSPHTEEDARLALVASDSQASSVTSEVERLGGSVERTLPSGVIIVEIPTASLEDFFEIEVVESISPTDTMVNLA